MTEEAAAAEATETDADPQETTETADTTESSDSSESKGLTPDKLAELNRTLRNERKAAERRAKEAEQRAQQSDQRWSQLAALFGDGKPGDASEFDPKAAFTDLQNEVRSERRARLLSEVARTEEVDPEDLHGDTEEEMRASAQKFKARLEARIDAALKAKNQAAAPPASTVTSDGKIAGPEQITSREELAKLTPAERVKAYQAGRLDGLMGKT